MRTRDTRALITRLRQEVEKRVDSVRGLPVWDAPRSWSQCIESRHRQSAIDAADRARLVEWVGSQTAGAYPTAALGIQAQPPESSASIVREADEILDGRYAVLGEQIDVRPQLLNWGAHPLTGATCSPQPWHRVSYLDGIGGGDVKALWELNRHAMLVRLGQAYWLRGDERYAERALELLDVWLRQSPPGRGINWTSSLEVGFRVVAWCWLWALTRDSHAWTEARMARFLPMVWRHADHVHRFDSSHYSPNTHLTGEAVALLYVSIGFPFLRGSDRWWARGEAILDAARERQLLPDGMHYERSVGYHRYTLEFYLHQLLLRRARGLAPGPARLEAAKRMLRVSAAFRRPDGSWPVIGDDDGGLMLRLTTHRPEDQGPLLALGAALLDESDFDPLISRHHREAVWWALGRDDSSSGVPRGESALPTTTALPAAGYYIARDDWGPASWYVAVDAGPHGGGDTGHAHTDLGHVEVAHGPVRLVSDPGCVSYTIGNAERDHARSEAVHASLVVPGFPLAVPSGPFSWTRLSPTPDVTPSPQPGGWGVALEYERVPRTLRHRRSVLLLRGVGVLVVDALLGAVPPGAHLHWPLPVEPRNVEPIDGGVRFNGHDVLMVMTDPGGLAARLEPLAASPTYGRVSRGTSLCVAVPATGPVTVATAFLVEGARLSMSGQLGEWRLTVATGMGSESLTIDSRGDVSRQPDAHAMLALESA
jgi:hypothetical protein